MLRKPLLLGAAAGALIMVQGAAVGQTQCGGIWAARCNLPKGPKKKAEDSAKAAGPVSAEEAAPNASANATASANANSADAAATPPNASATGVANANPNSAAATDTTGAAVVAGAGAMGASSVAGISTGQSVKSADGTVLGKVTEVVKASDGSITNVIVTSPTGRSFPVAAGKLSVNGGVVVVSDSSEQ